MKITITFESKNMFNYPKYKSYNQTYDTGYSRQNFLKNLKEYVNHQNYFINHCLRSNYRNWNNNRYSTDINIYNPINFLDQTGRGIGEMAFYWDMLKNILWIILRKGLFKALNIIKLCKIVKKTC